MLIQVSQSKVYYPLHTNFIHYSYYFEIITSLLLNLKFSKLPIFKKNIIVTQKTKNVISNTCSNDIRVLNEKYSNNNNENENENDDVVQKFNAFFNSNIQRLKRQLLQLQLDHHNTRVHRQQQKRVMRAACCRTKFTFRVPSSSQSLWLDMFATDVTTDVNTDVNTSKSTRRSKFTPSSHLQFNNQHVGLTFPTTETFDTDSDRYSDTDSDSNRYSESDLQQRNFNSNGNKDYNYKKKNDMDENWFPLTKAQVDHPTDNYNDNNYNNNNNKSLQSQWRIKRFTKHIGHGKQCYDFVRDCVLDWEFHNHYQDDDENDNENHDYDDVTLTNNDKKGAIIPKYSTNGILKALPPSNRKQHQMNKQQKQKEKQQYQSDLQSHHAHYLFPSSYYNVRRDTGVTTGITTGNSQTKTNPIPNNYYNDNDDNIISLSSSSPRRTRMVMGIEENDNPNILQVWTSSPTSSSISSTGGGMIDSSICPTSSSSSLSSQLSIAAIGRKLVTYTKCQILPFLPSIYNLNPVCVVYDVIDQNIRDNNYNNDNNDNNNNYNNQMTKLLTIPSSNSESSHHKTNHKHHQEKTLLEVNNNNSIFTSTAYATLRGHLLIGEERVTVVLRPNGKVDVEILSYSKPSSSPLGHFAFPIIGGMQHKFFTNELEFIKHSFDKECRRKNNVGNTTNKQ